MTILSATLSFSLLGSSAMKDISSESRSFSSVWGYSRRRRLLPSFFVVSCMVYLLSFALTRSLYPPTCLHIFSLSPPALCDVSIYTAMIARTNYPVHQADISYAYFTFILLSVSVQYSLSYRIPLLCKYVLYTI